MKWRLFCRLCGGDDPDAVRVYLWHIEQRRADGFIDAGKAPPGDPRGPAIYLKGSTQLTESMWLAGFDPRQAIPVDGFGAILGGAHRIACALALNISEIPVRRAERKHQAPDWDRAWFVAHGMNADDLARLDQDWATLTQGA